MKKIYTLAFSFTLCTLVFGQHTPESLQQKIAGKRKLDEIMKEVKSYYEAEELKVKDKSGSENKEHEFENGMTHWLRWEWYNRNRLDEKGELVDVAGKTLQAWDDVNKVFGKQKTDKSGTDANWNYLGPQKSVYKNGSFRGNSHIDRIIFHPTDPNILFVCAKSGGVWRTLDHGATWTNLTQFFPMMSASDLAINPDNPFEMYVITGYGVSLGSNGSCGIWKTKDGGLNWEKTSFDKYKKTAPKPDETPTYRGNRLTLMPGYPNVIFACTDSGMYRSADWGVSWILISGSIIYDVEFDPKNAQNVYFAAKGGLIFYSEDYGQTIKRQIPMIGPASNSRVELAISNNNPNYVYAVAGPFIAADSNRNQFGGVFRLEKSIDVNNVLQQNLRKKMYTPNILAASSTGVNDVIRLSKDTYQFVDIDQSNYDLAIAVNPNNAEELFVGGKIIWKSTNGGLSFVSQTIFDEGSVATAPKNYIHPDIQDLKYSPHNGFIYAATDGGIYFSKNGGTEWEDLTDGIQCATFYSLSGPSFNSDRLIGGTQDNGIKFKLATTDFMHIYGADGFQSVFGSKDTSAIYSVINETIVSFKADGTFGKNISSKIVNSTVAKLGFFPLISMDPIDDKILYVGTKSKLGVVRSNDAGKTWKQISTNEVGQAMVTCPNNASRLYYATGNSLGRSENRGDTWSSDLTKNPGFPSATDFYISKIAVSPVNSNFLCVANGGYFATKVLFSNDGGSNWVNVTDNIPSSLVVNCLVVDKGNNLYIGTDMGVFLRKFGETQWIPFYNNLPRIPVMSLVINEFNGKIRAGTYGAGVWEADLYTVCDADFTISTDVYGPKFYQTSNSIWVNSGVIGGDATNVTVRAGSEVILKDGFWVSERSTFNGVIGPCDETIDVVAIRKQAETVPSFVYQVDKGDSTTRYKYGTVQLKSLDKTIATYNVHGEYDGKYDVIVTDKSGENRLFQQQLDVKKEASQEVKINKASYTKGVYYMQLYYQGKLVHLQEMIVE